MGIDPQARLSILDVVQEETRNGAAVLYTTHYMDEAERLCNRILILDEGKVHAQGTLEELIALVGGGKVVTLRGEFEEGAAQRMAESHESWRLLAADQAQILLSIPPGEVGALLAAVSGSKLPVDDLSIREPDLQSVFIKLTGRELRD